ncbi:SAM-dependent methyltransferase [Mycobacterium kyorinense]|uniref:SAM-dependent methyltransferase n=1 Tax=Mycobacterium kyorinense TaxID=487514 RepID=UPI000A773AA7|nr:class I SAM-dependent methyltransferase [Mycobacterium kyorinense]
MDAETWDARYGEGELLWGVEPNTFVAAEMADAMPGRALDLACGEGRNAIWLASCGWRVTGIDFSAVGLQRAAQLASRAGVADRVSFQVVDVVTDPLPPGPFDAVIVAYLHLTEEARRLCYARRPRRLPRAAHCWWLGTTPLTSPREPVGRKTLPCCSLRRTCSPTLPIDEGLRWTRPNGVRRSVAGADADADAIDALVRLLREPPHAGTP